MGHRTVALSCDLQSSFREAHTIHEVCEQTMPYLNFSKCVFTVIATYLWVWPLQCENVDLYKNCGKDLHKHLIGFPPFSSRKSQLQSYLWRNAFLVEQQRARCSDSILLIVARFAIGLVNLSKRIRFFLLESFCAFSEQSWWALSGFEF